ncbi:MAG: hypothetical protein MI743_13655 [Sneathiellales bacterium]|nr:hypothetical protein [Sneathiellales bacterium]
MQRKSISRIHAVTGFLAFFTIATFWSSTIITELFLSQSIVVQVKTAIAYALIGFVPVMMAVGGTGFKLGGKSPHPKIAAKRGRMPFIVINGLFILVPSAIFLSIKANALQFDSWFYYVQLLELAAGAVNLTLMGLNIRDGLALTRKRPAKSSVREKSA